MLGATTLFMMSTERVFFIPHSPRLLDQLCFECITNTVQLPESRMHLSLPD